MKMSRERDAEVARESILDAAEDIFSRKGFDGARVDLIATQAGYNKSLIFHYFGDKEELYRAVIKRLKFRLSNEFLDPLNAFVQSSDEITRERVRIFLELAVECYFTFLTNHPGNLRMMAWEAAEGWQTFVERSPDLKEHQASLNCLSNYLKRGQEAGIISKQLDERFLMMNIGNMCIMHLQSLPRYRWFFGDELTDQPETLIHMQKQIVHLVLYGLFATNDEGKSS
jgi:AcrR family transcriptional regulator